MFENDYIMRMILQLTRALRKSLNRQYPSPAEEAQDIEGKIAEAVDLDPRLMFSLEPESLVSVLQLGSFDAKLAGYVVHSMYYEADILEKDGQTQKAALRIKQADAIAHTYGLEIAAADDESAALEQFLDEIEANES
jgi:hypothetical protein